LAFSIDWGDEEVRLEELRVAQPLGDSAGGGADMVVESNLKAKESK
jgi:hypothetical protein